jgi:hypothetical protein
VKVITCKLTLKDGDTIVARASSPAPDAEVPILYTGAIQRLGNLCQTANLPFLDFWIRERARNLGAEIEIQLEGSYDSLFRPRWQ